MEVQFIVSIVIVWFINAIIGYYIGRTKGRGQDGAILGFLLGPLGWIIVLLLGAKKLALTKRRKQPIVVQAEDPMAKWEREQQLAAASVSRPLLTGMNHTEESRLLRLKALLDRGMITQTEYEAKRTTILDEL